MKKLICIAIMMASIVSFAQSHDPVPRPNGTPYGYMEFKPTCAPTKLLVSLHGWGERGNGSTELNRVNRVGVAKRINAGNWKRTDFVVVSPQLSSTQKMFSPRTLHQFILAVCAKHAIDTTQIYLIGLSGGGNSIYSYITAGKWPVRAAVPIAGAGAYKLACNAIKTPLWAYHGDIDVRVSYKSAFTFINNYNKCSPPEPAQLTAYPGWGHESRVWETTFMNDAVFDWMARH